MLKRVLDLPRPVTIFICLSSTFPIVTTFFQEQHHTLIDCTSNINNIDVELGSKDPSFLSFSPTLFCVDMRPQVIVLLAVFAPFSAAGPLQYQRRHAQ